MKKRYYILIILLLLVALITTLVVTNNITQFDDVIYNFIFSLRNNSLDIFLKGITKLGNTIPILCIVIILLIKFEKKDRILLGSNAILSVLVNTIIKNIVQRPRPDHLRLIKQGGYSFPSGHSMIAICVYGTLIYLVHRKVKNRKIKVALEILLTIIILLIGISRIYVGVHYPSDVITGYLISIIILIINISILEKQFRGN